MKKLDTLVEEQYRAAANYSETTSNKVPLLEPVLLARVQKESIARACAVLTLLLRHRLAAAGGLCLSQAKTGW